MLSQKLSHEMSQRRSRIAPAWRGPSLANLALRGTVWWLRRTVKVGASSVRLEVSLRTTCLTEARQRADRLDVILGGRVDVRTKIFEVVGSFMELADLIKEAHAGDPSARAEAQVRLDAEARRAVQDAPTRLDDPAFEASLMALADREGWWHDDPDEIVGQFEWMLVGMETVAREYAAYCKRKGLDPETALPSVAGVRKWGTVGEVGAAPARDGSGGERSEDQGEGKVQEAGQVERRPRSRAREAGVAAASMAVTQTAAAGPVSEVDVGADAQEDARTGGPAGASAGAPGARTRSRTSVLASRAGSSPAPTPPAAPNAAQVFTKLADRFLDLKCKGYACERQKETPSPEAGASFKVDSYGN